MEHDLFIIYIYISIIQKQEFKKLNKCIRLHGPNQQSNILLLSVLYY